MDDRRPIRKTSLIRIDMDMLSGRTPSSSANNLIPLLIQKIIESIDGYKLKCIDVTISGIWEKEYTGKKEKKTL